MSIRRLGTLCVAAAAVALVGSAGGRADGPDVTVQRGQRATVMPTVTIRAARVLDRKGQVFENAVVEVQGNRISAARGQAGDLRPGMRRSCLMIDVHTHRLALGGGIRRGETAMIADAPYRQRGRPC
jgi:hypothetical protein